MPAKSRQQQKMIFARRSQYKTKAATPSKWKWIWEEGWEKLEEGLTFDQLYDMILDPDGIEG